MEHTADNVIEPNLKYCIIYYEGYLFPNLKFKLYFGAQIRKD